MGKIKELVIDLSNEQRESNALIAEFMGYEKTSKNEFIIPEHQRFDNRPDSNTFIADNLKYHLDWNWLIPVVIKCFDIRPHKMVYQHRLQLNDALLEADRDKLYKTVVEIVKRTEHG